MALSAGSQYGLSSQSKFNERKSLIFVKLTDSSQRAIDEYLRNKHKLGQNPTIQFLGHEGHLSFPSAQSSHGSVHFTFSLSNNQDMEGPQGAFECIQQTGPNNLESLGSLPCKMRIQANDDVYETTRRRLAVAEENNKNKCPRVIKVNGSDIGRKVKVKGTGRIIPPPVNDISRHRDAPSVTQVSTHSVAPAAAPTSSQVQQQRPYASLSSTAPSLSLPTNSRSNNSNTVNSRTQPEKKNADVARRPLKERLIHILALRPFKKPELYDRLKGEGLKERERSAISTILKQIAFMRDNTYHLQRHVWNDVQEEWPFYTEQEKAMLRRRKPQNLTPPGSSDGGSSGSGHSPNSTHPGSPPAIAPPPARLLNNNANNGSNVNKRPGFYEDNCGLPTKKLRISHCPKPAAPADVRTAPSNASSSFGSNYFTNSLNIVDGSRSASASESATSANNVMVNSAACVSKSQLPSYRDTRRDKSLSCSTVTSPVYSPTSPPPPPPSGASWGSYATPKSTRSENSVSSIDNATREMTVVDTEDVRHELKRLSEQLVSEKFGRYKNKVEEILTLFNDCIHFLFPDAHPSSKPWLSSSLPDHADYKSELRAITSKEERRKYKDMFNELCKTYKCLSKYCQEVNAFLRESINECKELQKQNKNSNVMHLTILNIYHSCINKDNRFTYLKNYMATVSEKMEYIRKLTEDYDKTFHGTSQVDVRNIN